MAEAIFLSMKKIINPHQRLSVETTLRSFEASLHRALEWLDGKEVNGILLQEQVQFSKLQRAQIRKKIAQAFEEIAKTSQILALEKEERNPSALLRSEMYIAWANLLDNSATKLRRYGEVNPQLTKILDPQIMQLSQIAVDLANLFDNTDNEQGVQNEHD
jgi:hypothetical protein